MVDIRTSFSLLPQTAPGLSKPAPITMPAFTGITNPNAIARQDFFFSPISTKARLAQFLESPQQQLMVFKFDAEQLGKYQWFQWTQPARVALILEKERLKKTESRRKSALLGDLEEEEEEPGLLLQQWIYRPLSEHRLERLPDWDPKDMPKQHNAAYLKQSQQWVSAADFGLHGITAIERPVLRELLAGLRPWIPEHSLIQLSPLGELQSMRLGLYWNPTLRYASQTGEAVQLVTLGRLPGTHTTPSWVEILDQADPMTFPSFSLPFRQGILDRVLQSISDVEAKGYTMVAPEVTQDFTPVGIKPPPSQKAGEFSMPTTPNPFSAVQQSPPS